MLDGQDRGRSGHEKERPAKQNYWLSLRFCFSWYHTAGGPGITGSSSSFVGQETGSCCMVGVLRTRKGLNNLGVHGRCPCWRNVQAVSDLMQGKPIRAM